MKLNLFNLVTGGRKMGITFSCKMDLENKVEKWNGKIAAIENYGSHYEIRIESRSGITVLVGKSAFGNFACIPDFNVGCYLANLKDKFWNSERLCAVLGNIDGITVASALQTIADCIDLN